MAALKARCSALEEWLRDLEARLAASELRNEDLVSQALSSDAKSIALAESLTQKEQLIRDLTRARAVLRLKLDEAQALNEYLAADIRALNEKLAANEYLAADIRALNEKLAAQVQALQAQVLNEKQAAQVQALQAQAVNEKQAAQVRVLSEALAVEATAAQDLRKRVEALCSSTSWRVTAPLRAVTQTLLKLKARIARQAPTAEILSQPPIGEPTEEVVTDLAPTTPAAEFVSEPPIGEPTEEIVTDFAPTIPTAEIVSEPPIGEPTEEIFTDLAPTTCGRILIIDKFVPTPDRTSAALRSWEMVKAICALGKSVIFGSDALPKDHYWVLSDVAQELGSYVEALDGLGVTTIFGYTEIVNHLKRYGREYQQVIICYPDLMYAYLPAVRAYATQAHVVYDTVDFHGLRMERESQVKGGEELAVRADHIKKIEIVSLRSADTVVAITENEREAILKLVPDTNVLVVPNIHILSEKPQTPLADRKDLLFIGHYGHSPNVDAVAYFVRDILPLVKQQIPEVQFFLLGNGMREEVSRFADETVKVIGYVPDPTPYFYQSRVFVAPLRFGAGMKGKIGQSMSLGLPVVTTSIGAEGMGLTHGVNALIADRASDFADSLCRLYTDDDLWRAIAHEAHDHIQRNFSPHAVRKQIETLLAAADDRPCAPT